MTGISSLAYVYVILEELVAPKSLQRDRFRTTASHVHLEDTRVEDKWISRLGNRCLIDNVRPEGKYIHPSMGRFLKYGRAIPDTTRPGPGVNTPGLGGLQVVAWVQNINIPRQYQYKDVMRRIIALSRAWPLHLIGYYP